MTETVIAALITLVTGMFAHQAFSHKWALKQFTDELKLGREERSKDRDLREKQTAVTQEIVKYQKANHAEAKANHAEVMAGLGCKARSRIGEGH